MARKIHLFGIGGPGYGKVTRKGVPLGGGPSKRRVTSPKEHHRFLAMDSDKTRCYRCGRVRASHEG